jgi:hypothetical protein
VLLGRVVKVMAGGAVPVELGGIIALGIVIRAAGEVGKSNVDAFDGDAGLLE